MSVRRLAMDVTEAGYHVDGLELDDAQLAYHGGESVENTIPEGHRWLTPLQPP